MMAKRTVVCVLHTWSLEICQRTKNSNILVTQQCGTHAANYHVNSDAKWNKETGLWLPTKQAQDETMRVPTAIVFMPVNSVTVADPPKTNIELTIMLVASLD